MKELLERLEELERLANAADEAYEADPENEAKEKAFDEAYNAEWEAFNRLADEITKVTDGAIDKATASTMIRTMRNELKELFNLAA